MSINQKAAVHRKPLYGMFTDIPPRYDLINTLITWGMDKRWRKKAALTCLESKPARLLDLCCGTGDLALTVLDLADYQLEVKGLDYSQPMLNIAEHKAGILNNRAVTFTQGDASRLPFPDGYFDCIGISYAFRNLTYKNPLALDHIKEIVRVLRPGGRCVIAESSQPKNGLIRVLYHFYMKQYAARIGGLISGNRAAYRYLGESSSSYYSPGEMEKFLLSNGFSAFSYQPLFFGASGIHTATK